MNEIKNQCGFATLEIILVVAIIGIFSSVAVPKMARIVDKVCLDYEMKHLYSDLNFARSVGKSSTFDAGIFPGVEEIGGGKVEFWIYGKYYGNKNARNHYQMMRTSVNSISYYRHNLTNGIELNFDHSNKILQISCYSFSISQTIDLKSKYGDSAQIKIDSVGRVRGEYVKQ